MNIFHENTILNSQTCLVDDTWKFMEFGYDRLSCSKYISMTRSEKGIRIVTKSGSSDSEG